MTAWWLAAVVVFVIACWLSLSKRRHFPANNLPVSQEKIHLNVAVLGDARDGTEHLADCIVKAAGARHGLEDPITSGFWFFEYDTPAHHYAQAVFPNSYQPFSKVLWQLCGLDGAILNVCVDSAISPSALEQCFWARAAGVPSMIVYMWHTRSTEPKNDLSTFENAMRDALRNCGYSPEDALITQGSAHKTKDNKWMFENVKSLLNIMDEMFSRRPAQLNTSFLMPIEDVFQIPNTGTIVTGRVQRGGVKVGQTLELLGPGKAYIVEVANIEMFARDLDSAQAGDNVGINLKGISKENVARGMILAEVNTLQNRTRVNAEIYLLKPEEGGSQLGIQPNVPYTLFAQALQIDVRTEFPDKAGVLQLGQNASLALHFPVAVSLEEGTRFLLRSNGTTVALGVVK